LHPMDSAHHLSHPACQADFTYEITVKTIKILDNGKGAKLVTKDLEAVLRKIEAWHQGSISGFTINYRDTGGAWLEISWDGKQGTERVASPEP